ncbi:MAG: hypothetical protein SFX72_09975 [Isosphaeraceae bacterium]|nr:hypothetical protein [Isosphaeraceae bacterium]
MPGIFLLLTCAFCSQQEAKLDQNQFHEIMRKLHQDWTDVTLIFEGESKRTGSEEKTKADRNFSFQGEFSANSRGEWYQETFAKSLFGDREVRAVEAVSEKKGYQAAAAPTPGSKSRGVRTELYPRGIMRAVYSPAQYLFPFHFIRLTSIEVYAYEFLGWEDVDGVRCLKVMIDNAPRNTSSLHAIRHYWLDLARGGHALRIRTLRGGRLSQEIDGIVLQEFKTDRGPRWFPVQARISEYFRDGISEPSPFNVELNYAVRDTVVLNKGLPESTFDVWERLNSPGHPRVNGLRSIVDQKYLKRYAKSNEDRRPKEAVEAHLEKAEAQREVLDASKSAGDERNWTSLTQSLVPAAAAVLVCVGLVWWRTRKA